MNQYTFISLKQLVISLIMMLIIIIMGMFFTCNTEIPATEPELFDVQICLYDYTYVYGGVNDFSIDWNNRIVELKKNERILVMPFERINWVSIPPDYYNEFFKDRRFVK